MPEALASIFNDSAEAPRSFMKRRALALARRAKAFPAWACLVAVLSAVPVGIGVNALVLQRERHPAPLFGPAPQPASSAVSVSGAPPVPRLISAAPIAASAPALPPARPAEIVNGSRPSRARDPMRNPWRGEPRTNAVRLTFAAQTALVQLGYGVETDGNEGSATHQALRDFERAHGLPFGTEITPQLVKQLLTAARIGGR